MTNETQAPTDPPAAPPAGPSDADAEEALLPTDDELRATALEYQADWLRLPVGLLPPRILLVAYEAAPGQTLVCVTVGKDWSGQHVLVARSELQDGQWAVDSSCVAMAAALPVVVLHDDQGPPRLDAPHVRESYARGLLAPLQARLRELVAPALCALMVRAAPDLWDADALWPGGFALATVEQGREPYLRLWGTGPLLVCFDSPLYATLEEAVAELHRLAKGEPITRAALRAAGYRP